jgi:hypothetical protein
MADPEGIAKWGSVLERSCWLLVLTGMLTQVSAEYAFPSYNVAIGFWGTYCAFGKHGRATFGLLTFSFFGVLLDIVFCSINNGPSSSFQFALVMLIFCLFIKVYLLFCGAHFFSAIGGERTMEQSLYDSLPTHGSLSTSAAATAGGGYSPPLDADMPLHQHSLSSAHG